MNRKPYEFLAAAALIIGPGFDTAGAMPVVHVQLFMHCEAPSVPDTPNFKTMTAIQADNAASTSSYRHWRNQLKTYGDMCHARGIKLNYQSDWNFLEGVWQWEIKTPLSGITSDTGGLNVLQYLVSLGHEVDPHSHQTQGYTYADVAFLLAKCGVADTGVCGGHVLDATTFDALEYDDLTVAGGVAPGIYTSAQTDPLLRAPNWSPRLLMGGASAGHENDPHVSGIWRPASATDYFGTSTNPAAIPAIGQWTEDPLELWRLVADLRSGRIAHDNKVWTVNIATNHRDIVTDSYLQTDVRAVLDTLKTWQDGGYIVSNTYQEMLDDVWPNQYGGVQHIHQRPDDHVAFSLNWQDFYFKDRSAAALEAILDHHESLGMPLDVFFTTWQSDIIADEHPDLMGRLASSALVSQGYHVRPPKPYASGFEWGTLAQTSGVTDAQRRDVVENYESYRLDPNTCVSHATAVPDSAHQGGFARITALQGYAPVCVGALPATVPVNLTNTVYDYFHDPDDDPANGAGGAKMLVRHTSYTNLNTRWNHPQATSYSTDARYLFYRPEHYDWKLITLWNTSLPDYDPSQTLTDCFSDAHATASAGGRAPWFVGIKLHDNDLFASQSAWTLVWPSENEASWDLGQLSPSLELNTSTQAGRLTTYQSIVTEAASRHAAEEINVVNSMDTMSLQFHPVTRPLGLSRTKVVEEAAVGSTLCLISGGGVISGQNLRYQLVSGAGSDDNADFLISGNELRTARRLDYETKPTLHLRVSWEWVDATGGATVLASGERALTLVLGDSNEDDDDADGQTQAEEALAGTDPNDAQSFFRPLDHQFGGDGSFSTTIAGVAGRVYRLQSSTDLVTWTDEADPEATQTVTSGGEIILRDDDPLPELPRLFYRVAVSLAP